MNLADRNAHIRAFFDECAALIDRKGKDYGVAGAFGNFEEIAKVVGSTREDVLWTLLAKHLVTIRGGTSTTEPMRQRIADAVNYLAILEAMRAEKGLDSRRALDTHAANGGKAACGKPIAAETMLVGAGPNRDERPTCQACCDAILAVELRPRVHFFDVDRAGDSKILCGTLRKDPPHDRFSWSKVASDVTCSDCNDLLERVPQVTKPDDELVHMVRANETFCGLSLDGLNWRSSLNYVTCSQCLMAVVREKTR